MDYRDDRDALRARAESLESDLAAARDENERLRGVEAVLTSTERENARLRAEVRRLTPSPGRRGGVLVALLSVAGLALCMGGVAFLLVARPAPAPVAQTPDMPPVKVAGGVEGPAPAAHDEPSKSARGTTVEWPARVVRATGLSYAAGAACTVRATARSDGEKTLSPDVEIDCPGKVLYRSKDPLEGTSMFSYRVDEAPGPEEGSYRVALSYQDQGTRSGERTQASVSTADRVAVAWSDTAPSYRVELELDELSSPWKGPALFASDEQKAPAFREPVTRAGRAALVRDNGLVTQGAACVVRVTPSFSTVGNCRVTVRCGETTLYGANAGGYAACTAEGGRVFSAADPEPSPVDRDPSLDLSFPRSAVEVSDTTPNAWSVKVQLAP